MDLKNVFVVNQVFSLANKIYVMIYALLYTLIAFTAINKQKYKLKLIQVLIYVLNAVEIIMLILY